MSRSSSGDCGLGNGLREHLLASLALPEQRESIRKVSIIGGAGAVGLACAYSFINQGTQAANVVLIDVPQVQEKLIGEISDLQHGSAYGSGVRVTGGCSYELTKGSDVVIITAGARQAPGESRLDLVGRNLAIFKGIIPKVVAASPECVIIVVSNPCDIMTYIVQKLSGFPVGRVFGTGTALDSSRFRTLVAERLGVDTRSVHGMVVGEHGDSSVAVWSQLNVGGIRLRDIAPALGAPGDPERWESIHEEVISAASSIIKAKGYTSWAIGLTVASLTAAVMRNEHRVVPLSVPVRGMYEITQDVYLSLPATLGRGGVRDVLRVPLEPGEILKLRDSAAAIHAVQCKLNLDFGDSASIQPASTGALGAATTTTRSPTVAGHN